MDQWLHNISIISQKLFMIVIIFGRDYILGTVAVKDFLKLPYVRIGAYIAARYLEPQKLCNQCMHSYSDHHLCLDLSVYDFYCFASFSEFDKECQLASIIWLLYSDPIGCIPAPWPKNTEMSQIYGRNLPKSGRRHISRKRKTSHSVS